MKKVWLIVAIIILVGAGSAAGAYYYRDSKAKTEKTNLENQISDLNKKVKDSEKSTTGESASTPTSSTSSTSTTTPTTTPAVTTDANKTAAETVVTNYLNAKKTRLLENAKVYMTSAYYASSSQDSFAGTSSPSMGKFEIVGSSAGSAAKTYTVTAKLYWYLQGVEQGYDTNTYEVVYESGKYLVNATNVGKFTGTTN